MRRFAGRSAVMVWVALAAWMPASVRAAEYTVGPPPAWVTPVKPGVASSDQLSEGSGGEVYLLTDTQVLADDAQRVTYRRMVTTAVNASGVESIANIQIPFDPSYQTLVLHAINIVRGGRVIPKLATARIQVLQRETQLEAQIYDGAKTVSVFLDDVRVGDTVDYAYSITGRNPVFKGRDFGMVALQFAVPVARIHERLLLSPDKPVIFAARNTSIKPVVSEHAGLRDYTWDVTHPATLKVESDAPPWYMPYADVAWSEYADWAAVAHWAQPLYQVPPTLSPALQTQVDRIAKAEPTPTGRMLAALRLVQSEVRYLGVEIGQNSHAPNPPDLVYARRFGDCKDKTLLTLTLLHGLGIDAHAALVNTRVQRGLADVLPSPGMFDHVLVQARIGAQTWWIDPTRYLQEADPAHLYQPDYGLALIVDAGTQGLTAMKHADPMSAGRDLHAVFDARAGFDKPVAYTQETVAAGKYAELMRTWLSATNLTDAQKAFLNFYAKSYPHITAQAPLQVQDDKPDNRITTKETYAIADMRSPSADGKHREVDFHLLDILRVMREPQATVRKSPLYVVYPQDVSERTEVLLPAAWPLKPSSTSVEDPAFRFQQTVAVDGARLIITDHYQALTDEVGASDVPRYASNLARAREAVGYELSWNNAAAASTTPPARRTVWDRINWTLWLLVLAMLGMTVTWAFKVYRYDPPPRIEPDTRWVGIGGWLLWLALLLTVRPLVYGHSLVKLASVLSGDRWSALTTYGSHSYNALWAPLLLLETADASVQCVFSLLLLVLLFQRRSSFPRVALMVLAAGMAAHVVDVYLVSQLPSYKDASQAVMRAVDMGIGVAIWSVYLLRSRRVRATFVKRYRLSAPPPVHAAVSVDEGEVTEPA